MPALIAMSDQPDGARGMVGAFHQTMGPTTLRAVRSTSPAGASLSGIERSFGPVPTESLPFSASVQVVSGPAISAPSGV